ncbi:uncharacterized protein SCDLUD_005277 [Saccharomycodes ludwigii]|uniref:uncharacterized protein n=1 Tax=Saccharomycodes ludwigii TaxID=36035 RepID=UPI001E8A4AD4|nr:hypothetical protein SCDLUD_005277 [Saccharomycodes ludwigii]KAH3898930.1 hypothetical protein SCDLUD_005277 [Saccharomycodes ludwigii]
MRLQPETIPSILFQCKLIPKNLDLENEGGSLCSENFYRDRNEHSVLFIAFQNSHKLILIVNCCILAKVDGVIIMWDYLVCYSFFSHCLSFFILFFFFFCFYFAFFFNPLAGLARWKLATVVIVIRNIFRFFFLHY